MQHETRRFPATTASVADARRFLRTTLAGRGHAPDVVDDAVLILSELASNVVEHAGTEYEVDVSIVGARARVEVTDGSEIVPDVRDPADDSERGRGLRLLTALATAWGTERRPTGKAVWFEVLLVTGGL